MRQGQEVFFVAVTIFYGEQHTYSKGATMTQQHYSLKEVAKIVGVKAHRISYAVSNGYLPEPAARITNRRMFTDADVEAAKKYFASQLKIGRPVRKEDGR